MMIRLPSILPIFITLLPTSHTFIFNHQQRPHTTHSHDIIQFKRPIQRQQIRMTAADDDINANADEATTTGDDGTTNEPEDIFKDDNDLTNRFKYKVNALMGSYDPLQSDADTEQTDGNILNALLQFPTLYTFNIVGRTTSGGGDNGDGDDSIKDAYVEQVKSIVVNGCGSSSSSGEEEDSGDNIAVVVDDNGNDKTEDTPTTVMSGAVEVVPDDATTTTTTDVEMKDTVVCVVKPRGKKFTKITVEVMVESAAMINSVYEELGLLERTVMRF